MIQQKGREPKVREKRKKDLFKMHVSGQTFLAMLILEFNPFRKGDYSVHKR